MCRSALMLRALALAMLATSSVRADDREADSSAGDRIFCAILDGLAAESRSRALLLKAVECDTCRSSLSDSRRSSIRAAIDRVRHLAAKGERPTTSFSKDVLHAAGDEGLRTFARICLRCIGYAAVILPPVADRLQLDLRVRSGIARSIKVSNSKLHDEFCRHSPLDSDRQTALLTLARMRKDANDRLVASIIRNLTGAQLKAFQALLGNPHPLCIDIFDPAEAYAVFDARRREPVVIIHQPIQLIDVVCCPTVMDALGLDRAQRKSIAEITKLRQAAEAGFYRSLIGLAKSDQRKRLQEHRSNSDRGKAIEREVGLLLSENQLLRAAQFRMQILGPTCAVGTEFADRFNFTAARRNELNLGLFQLIESSSKAKSNPQIVTKEQLDAAMLRALTPRERTAWDAAIGEVVEPSLLKRMRTESRPLSEQIVGAVQASAPKAR
jgi:hypothetical protein